MMLGFLLARAGVDVVVLEKHADFLCDFRGETIHPSPLELSHELGLLEEFLREPHQELRELRGIGRRPGIQIDHPVLLEFDDLLGEIVFVAIAFI